MTHSPILETRRWHWPDEAACAGRAATLAARAAIADAFVELHGPLGAGKTTFVRHLLRALGVKGRVKSPTFAVLEPYQVGDLTVSHFDFYRFENAHELADAGFRDIFAAPGLKLAEWPEHVAALLPPADVALHIAVHDDGSRTVRVEARSACGLALLG